MNADKTDKLYSGGGGNGSGAEKTINIANYTQMHRCTKNMCANWRKLLRRSTEEELGVFAAAAAGSFFLFFCLFWSLN